MLIKKQIKKLEADCVSSLRKYLCESIHLLCLSLKQNAHHNTTSASGMWGVDTAEQRDSQKCCSDGRGCAEEVNMDLVAVPLLRNG
jgi:hypothetical protein